MDKWEKAGKKDAFKVRDSFLGDIKKFEKKVKKEKRKLGYSFDL